MERTLEENIKIHKEILKITKYLIKVSPESRYMCLNDIINVNTKLISILSPNSPNESYISANGSNLDSMIKYISKDYWYHWSHLEFSIIATAIDKTLPISNATDHFDDGKPISFYEPIQATNMDTFILNCIIVRAILKQKLAQLIKQQSLLDDKYHHVPSGHGPLLAYRGKLIKFPAYGVKLSTDGLLVERLDGEGAVELEGYE